MSKYLASEIEVGGHPVFIEVQEEQPHAESQGPMPAGGGRTPEELLPRLQLAGEAAAATCAGLYSRIEDRLSNAARPEEITIEFGLSLGGEAGVPFVAKGKAEATFKVAATWKLASTATAKK